MFTIWQAKNPSPDASKNNREVSNRLLSLVIPPGIFSAPLR
jgi:hypothetical protein